MMSSTLTKKTTICSEWPVHERPQILTFVQDVARNGINQRRGEVID